MIVEPGPRGERVLGAVHRVEVGPDGAVEVVLFQLVERLVIHLVGGVVDEDVEPACRAEFSEDTYRARQSVQGGSRAKAYSSAEGCPKRGPFKIYTATSTPSRTAPAAATSS